MILAVGSGIFVSILCAFFGKWIRGKLSVLLSLLPFGIFLYFLNYIPEIAAGKTFRESYPWVKSIGLNLDFYLDGLALLFVLLISGIGTLIFFYASSYLKGSRYLDRFFGYLALFMAAMLGMVLADNILLLFIFWELTSISSFFLIGFNNEEKASRKSALLALGITGGGGFFLLGGMILMGYLSGTYSIQEMIGSTEFLKSHTLYPLMFATVFLGAMTKSAQFPFHFWLPGAMKAPTPVSAYLHSATMVKAGIFLLARLNPVLGNTEIWMYTLMVVGLLTMVLGAIKSVFQTDMKSVLAFTTISALGILVFLLGMGTKEALIAAATFIIVHALYKAALFLVTGIVDHETGTRDLTQLSGLKGKLPLIAFIGFIAAFSSAGVPLTFGFIGKDLIYEATLHNLPLWSVILTASALITNVFLFAGGFMVGIRPFFGKLSPQFSNIRMPNEALWLPPLLLALLSLLFGIWPASIGDALLNPVAASIYPFQDAVTLKIWHGFNQVLILSIVTLILGTVLYFANSPSARKQERISKLKIFSTHFYFEQFWVRCRILAIKYTNFWHNGYLRSYMFKVLLFSVGLLGYKLYKMGFRSLDSSVLSPVSFYEIAIALVLIVAVYLTITTISRLTAVVATSVIGFCICLLFVIYSAPDLALTQFSIDTLTVVLFVLVLFRLPPFLNFANSRTKLRDAILAISFGLIIAYTALHVLHEPMYEEVSQFYGENAYVLAKGKNVVNVILVDFRGFDTMFEIIVLSIAAIGVYSLLKLRLKPSEKE